MSPILIGSPSTSNDDNGNGELAARAPDFGCALPNMHDFVSRRLVSGRTETRRPRELPHGWSQRFDSLVKRNAEQSEDADRRQERNKSRHPGHFMCLVFVGG